MLRQADDLDVTLAAESAFEKARRRVDQAIEAALADGCDFDTACDRTTEALLADKAWFGVLRAAMAGAYVRKVGRDRFKNATAGLRRATRAGTVRLAASAAPKHAAPAVAQMTAEARAKGWEWCQRRVNNPASLLRFPIGGKPLGDCTRADLVVYYQQRLGQARADLWNATFIKVLIPRLGDDQTVKDVVSEAELAEWHEEARRHAAATIGA